MSLKTHRHEMESMKERENSLRTMVRGAHDHVNTLAQTVQRVRRESQTEKNEMVSSENRMNNRIKYYESENAAVRIEKEDILEHAKRIQIAFEDQIARAHAHREEEANHAEIRTRELTHAKREHEHSLDSLSSLMKTTVQRVRRDSMERCRNEFQEASEKAEEHALRSKSKARAEIEDMEDLIRHHRGEFETSARRHVRTLGEMEEEHKRTLSDRKRQHDDEIRNAKEQHERVLRDAQREHLDELTHKEREYLHKHSSLESQIMNAKMKHHEEANHVLLTRQEVTQARLQHEQIVQNMSVPFRESQEYKNEIQLCVKRHDELCANHELALKNMRQDTERELQRVHAETLRDQHRELRERHDTVLQDRMKTYESEMARLKDSHSETLRDQHRELRELHGDELHNRHRDVLKHHEMVLRDSRDEHEHTLRDARREHEIMLKETREEHEQNLRDTQNAHEMCLRKISEKHENTLKDTRARHEHTLLTNRVMEESRLNELKNLHLHHVNARLDDQQKVHHETVEKFRQKHAQHIDLMHRRESILQRKFGQLGREFEASRLSGVHEVKMISKHLSRLELYESRIRDMREEHRDELKRVFRVVRAEMYEEYESRLFRAKESLALERHRHAENVVVRMQEHRREILSENKQELSDHKSRWHEEKSLEMRTAHEKHRNALDEARRGHRDHLDQVLLQHQRNLRQMKKTHDEKHQNELDEIRTAHREHLDRVHLTHKHSLTEARRELNVYHKEYQDRLIRLQRDKDQVNEFLTGLLHEKHGAIVTHDDDHRYSTSMFPAHASGNHTAPPHVRSKQRTGNVIKTPIAAGVIARRIMSSEMFPSSSDVDETDDDDSDL